MKSGIIAFSTALFVLFLSFFCVIANASNRHVYFAAGNEPAKSEITSAANNKTVILQPDKSGSGHAPSAITIIVTHYQLRIANIIWINSAPGLPGIYYVERQVSFSGPWELLKQLPYNAPPEYNDTINYPYCTSTNFSYRVRFVSVSGTNDATSGIADILLSDLTSPANLQNVNVTLAQTPGGFNPRLTWSRITNDSISGYEIGRSNGFKWPKIITQPADSSGFTHKVFSVCDSTFKYVIVTIDKCGNRSAPDYKLFVQTLKLQVQQPGHCEKNAKLTWNSYNAMAGGLGGYKIYRSDGGAAPVEIDTKDTTYTDNYNFIKGHTYLYSLKAYSKDGIHTSISCEVVWPFNTSLTPDVYISQVSVENESYINVKYHITPPVSVYKLRLERSDNGTSNFKVVDSLVVAGGFVPSESFFNDTTANVNTHSYFYRLVAYDDCGGITNSVNISQSILLKCGSSHGQNLLNWNGYQSWLQGIEGYKVYRTLNNQPATIELIGSVNPAANSFTDDLTGIDQSKLICYQVEANENPLNPYLTNALSKSNTCCVLKEPILFMPNAFNPDGINRFLRPKPVPLFVDPQSFKMIVFSRWGEQLFETSDMNSGWDGMVNGKTAPAGLYSYILTYDSLDGKGYTKRGTAMLVR